MEFHPLDVIKIIVINEERRKWREDLLLNWWIEVLPYFILLVVIF